MPEQFDLNVQARQILGKRVRRLRIQGITPANISGATMPSVAIQLPEDEMKRLLKHRTAGVLRIHVGKSSRAETALLNRVERDPITSEVLHVDFRRVRLDQPVRARVPLHLTGEAPAIKIHNGVLLHLLDSLEIEALPGNIPEAVTLDISPLEELNSVLTVADIQVPSKVKLLTSPDEPAVTIKPPRIEVEVEAPAAAAAPEAAPTPEEATAEGASPTES